MTKLKISKTIQPQRRGDAENSDSPVFENSLRLCVSAVKTFLPSDGDAKCSTEILHRDTGLRPVREAFEREKSQLHRFSPPRSCDACVALDQGSRIRATQASQLQESRYDVAQITLIKSERRPHGLEARVTSKHSTRLNSKAPRSLRVALLGVLLGLAGSIPAQADVAEARHGMVASVQPLATDAGVAILKDGGNAVDAAIATALTLGVVDGHNSGIGGGCFMLVRLADGRMFALDGREMAGAKATADMFIRDGKGDTNLSQTGSLASGVPGSLAVYQYAAEHFGKKKLADLLAPGIDEAEHGFPLGKLYARGLAKMVTTLAKFPSTASIFLKPDGTPFAAGDIIKQPDLAASYRAIASNGIGWFYGGPFAQATEKWMTANGGILTATDFAGYQMKVRDPIVTHYRDYTIVGFPPPSSGGVHVAEILNILNHFDIAALQKQDPALRVHVISEAMKLAFADRAFWLGDPDFVHVPRGLIDADYGAELAKKISLDKCLVDIDHGTPPNANDDYFGKHTTHIAAADEAGNWVGITATVNTFMGSKVIIPGTGIIMNDQMDDFSIQPGVPNAFHLIGGEANAPGPGKRPLSSMSPTIILHDGQPVITVGAAGGPTIITQVLLVTSNLIDLGDDLGTAMARPRFHHQWSPDVLSIENTFDPKLLDELRKMGHTLEVKSPVGATQAILRRPDGMLVGASEPRLPGKAGGW